MHSKIYIKSDLIFVSKLLYTSTYNQNSLKQSTVMRWDYIINHVSLLLLIRYGMLIITFEEIWIHAWGS